MRRFGCSVFWKACAKGCTSRLRRNDFSSDFASILRNAIAILSLSDGFQKKSASTFSVCMDKNAGYLAHIPSMHPLSCIIFIFLHLFYHRFTNLPSLRHDPDRIKSLSLRTSQKKPSKSTNYQNCHFLGCFWDTLCFLHQSIPK